MKMESFSLLGTDTQMQFETLKTGSNRSFRNAVKLQQLRKLVGG